MKRQADSIPNSKKEYEVSKRKGFGGSGSGKQADYARKRALPDSGRNLTGKKSRGVWMKDKKVKRTLKSICSFPEDQRGKSGAPKLRQFQERAHLGPKKAFKIAPLRKRKFKKRKKDWAPKESSKGRELRPVMGGGDESLIIHTNLEGGGQEERSGVYERVKGVKESSSLAPIV